MQIQRIYLYSCQWQMVNIFIKLELKLLPIQYKFNTGDILDKILFNTKEAYSLNPRILLYRNVLFV